MASDLEVAAYHEAGHAVVAWLHGATIDWLSLRHLPDTAWHHLATMTRDQVRLVKALVAVSGALGERLFAGSTRDLYDLKTPTGGGDWDQFERDVGYAFLVKDWHVETAEYALTELAKDLLERNDRLVHALAARVLDCRHIYGGDVHAILRAYGQTFGVHRGPVMEADWQTATRTALEGYRASLLVGL